MSRFLKLAAVSALAIGAAGCSSQPHGGLTAAHNFSVYSLHQPVVEHTNFVFDVNTDPGGISTPRPTGSPAGSTRSTSLMATGSRSTSRAAMNRRAPARTWRGSPPATASWSPTSRRR